MANGLMALRSAVTAATWPSGLVGWQFGLNPCSPVWSGVTCAASQPVALDLSYKGLQVGTGMGRAVWAVERLSSKRVECSHQSGCCPQNLALSLTSSPTSTPPQGTLASGLGFATTLQSIQLSGNALSGSLPPQWSLLTALTSLDLSSNALTGTLPDPFSTLIQLHDANLASNQLYSTLPASWGVAMTSLVRLVVNSNVNL